MLCRMPLYTKSIITIICIFFMLNTYSQQKDPHLTNRGDSVLNKVEIEASFPGGDAAWSKYIVKTFDNANVV
jgi:hypothetical protein